METVIAYVKTHAGDIVAWLALILSQFPPLREMLKGRKLDMVVAEGMRITHIYGSPSVALWVQFENTGGKPLSVRRVICEMERVDGPTCQLMGRVYWVTARLGTESEMSLPLPSVGLKSGERWQSYVQFWDPGAWSKDQERRIKDLIARVKADLEPRVAAEAARAIAESRAPAFIEVSPQLLNEVGSMVAGRRVLEAGEYRIRVRCYGDGNDELLERRYALALFEADIRELYADVDDYKYGFGLNYASPKSKWIDSNLRIEGLR